MSQDEHERSVKEIIKEQETELKSFGDDLPNKGELEQLLSRLPRSGERDFEHRLFALIDYYASPKVNKAAEIEKLLEEILQDPPPAEPPQDNQASLLVSVSER